MAELHPHLQHSDVERIVETIFQVIGEALARGARIEIRGFGAFTIRHRPRSANMNHGRSLAQSYTLLQNRQAIARETERNEVGNMLYKVRDWQPGRHIAYAALTPRYHF
jgi:hypothetical protein